MGRAWKRWKRFPTVYLVWILALLTFIITPPAAIILMRELR